MTADINEKQLVEEAKRNPEAFGKIYELYIDKIYSYIYHRIGHQHEAEDLTAKVFFRALDNLNKYNDTGVPFSAWLFRIAHNLVANWHRDQSRHQTVSIDDLNLRADQRHNPPEVVEKITQQEILLKAIHLLPPERQELLFFKFVESMSNAEIGKVMGRTETAVKSLYHRTVLSLRELLAEHSGFLQPPSEKEW